MFPNNPREGDTLRFVQGRWQTGASARIVAAPASAAAAGTPGDIAYDADYFYVCTATNTWARFAKAAW
jgi:hypothetical protein